MDMRHDHAVGRRPRVLHHEPVGRGTQPLGLGTDALLALRIHAVPSLKVRAVTDHHEPCSLWKGLVAGVDRLVIPRSLKCLVLTDNLPGVQMGIAFAQPKQSTRETVHQARTALLHSA